MDRQKTNIKEVLTVSVIYLFAAVLFLKKSDHFGGVLSMPSMIFFCAASVLILTALYYMCRDFDIYFLYVFLAMCLVTAVYCSFRFSVNLCPDEEGRILLSNWIYKYGTLPTGYEYELIDPDPLLDPYHDYSSPNWGYDYAFTPYLPSMLGALLMKAVSLFSTSQSALLTAARSVNIFGYAVVMIYSVKLSEELFGNRSKLFVMMIAGIPQILFMSGYLNNDLFSLMSSLMIIYYLIRCHRTGWDIKMCIMLGISVSVSLLTYYFGYGLILLAAIWAAADCTAYAKNHCDDPKNCVRFVTARAAAVIITVLLLAGWYFIRNAVIYSGDVFGIKSQHQCAELYEAAGHEVYDPPTFNDRNATWKYWFDISLKSLVGIFGYMDKLMDTGLYCLYDIMFLTGMIMYALSLPGRIKEGKTAVFKELSVFLTVLFPLIFSMYRSYTYDFEPQGRYIITALPAIAYMISYGYRYIRNLIPAKLKAPEEPLNVENILCPLLAVIWITALVKNILPLAVY